MRNAHFQNIVIPKSNHKITHRGLCPCRVGGGLSTSVPSSNRTYGFPVYCSPMALPHCRECDQPSLPTNLQQTVSIHKPFRLSAWRLSHEIPSPISYLICASISPIGRFRQSRIPSHSRRFILPAVTSLSLAPTSSLL